MYVLEKTVATFGTFFLLYQYTEHYIMPHVPDASRGQSFLRSLLDLALPFMVCACMRGQINPGSPIDRFAILFCFT
jgi:sterol O-acyltransferase